jgi:hypothetical protein
LFARHDARTLHKFGSFFLLRSRRKRLSVFGEFDTPKSGRGLAEFYFHVTIRGPEVALAGHHSDDFAPGLLVGEKKQLTGGHRSGKADDGAVFEHQYRAGLFGKEVALAAAVAWARTGGDDWDFKSYRIGLWRGRGPARFCRARRRRGWGTARIHNRSHDKIAPRAPEGGAFMEKTTAAESRPHDSPANI